MVVLRHDAVSTNHLWEGLSIISNCTLEIGPREIGVALLTKFALNGFDRLNEFRCDFGL